MEKYHISSRVFHWLMAAIIIPLLIAGIYMVEFLPKDASYRGTVYNLHKSFGVIALLLVFPRIINRFLRKVPALPQSMPKWQVIASHIAHYKLYILMLLMPISGYLMSNSYGYPVKLFGLPLPFLADKNYENAAFFASCHKYLGYAFIAIVTIHIVAVIKHRFFDKKEHDVLGRMV